jgi:hypothetical protein
MTQQELIEDLSNKYEQEGVVLTIKTSEGCEFNQKKCEFKYHENLMRKLYTMLEEPSLGIAFTLIPLWKPSFTFVPILSYLLVL